MTASNGGTVRYTAEGPIATIVFDRPSRRNALTREMVETFLASIRAAEERPEIRAIVVAGADGDFCAGGDIDELIPAYVDDIDDESFGPDDELFAFALRYESISTPIVAAVTGACIGAGMELLHATDIRIAGESAEFGHQEPRWGLFPAGGATVRLPRQVPYCRAMEYLLTGDRFDAEHARQAGLVNEVVPSADVRDRARTVAESIAANSPTAVAAIKSSVVGGLDRRMTDAFALEAELAREAWTSADAAEGIAAFREGRPPSFDDGSSDAD
ncbi:enoyl-CoA hydratase/isomerase family protein [Halovivax gelatinilyticus]|uniref:enoyl-CoA hydratase/isomerase family protein n=1 Tax=Halovivax gelatinilyticus TaxID=2961597 RepID=UPI0020CA7A96|nr:enoyl-CoA hydratase-related protein [Halovivax gelatinilyticus]